MGSVGFFVLDEVFLVTWPTGGEGFMHENSIISTQLSYFVLTYRKGGFAAAARAVPMSAQGLTKAVHALERNLGAVLFESKGGAALHPTQFADHLYELVERWSTDEKELRNAFRQMKNDSSVIIYLGAAIGTLGFLGIDMAVDFERAHPGIRLKCIETPDLLTEDYLENGEYNIAFTTYPYNPNFDTIELYRSDVYAWVPKNNKLSGQDRLSIEDFDGEHLGIVDSSFKVHDQFESACDERGVCPKSIATTAEIFWLYSYAHSGKGIGISAKHLKNVFAKTDTVVCLSVEGLQWNFGISTRRSYTPTEEETIVIDFLKKRAAQRTRSTSFERQSIEKGHTP